MNKIAGIILICVGLLGIVYGGMTYTTKEKVIDLGPIEATRDKTHSLPIPPIAGALAMIGGVVLLVTSKSQG